MRIKYIITCFFCVLFALSKAQIIDPSDIAFISINPYTHEVTTAWYKSESPNIASIRIHYVYDITDLIKAKPITEISINSDSSIVFSTDTLLNFYHNVQEAPISIACDAYATNGLNSTSLREYHSSIHCTSSFTTCPSQITITWSPYIGHNIQISKYEIIEVDNIENILLTVSGNTLSATISGNQKTQRHFFVKAYFTDTRGIAQTSTSNSTFISTPILHTPSYITPYSIEVLDSSNIRVSFLIDTATSFSKYGIYYSVANHYNFIFIDTITANKHSISPLAISHKNGFKHDTAVYYKLVAFDNCHEPIASSLHISPIRLQGLEATPTKHILQWTDNEIWPEGVDYYTVIKISKESEYLPIESTKNLFAIDEFPNDFQYQSEMCYKILAYQNIPNMPAVSTSNTFCFTKQLLLHIPNAINPTSSIEQNRIFKPKYAFFSGSYSLEIFNRYGACIFTSHNIDHGWDGKTKDSFVPQGAYQYRIRITTELGETIERIGSISVLYN